MIKLKWFMSLLAGTAALYLLHRWGSRWGGTEAEHHQQFPGDEIVPQPHLVFTNAISVQAAPEAIWPWLVQMGYYRGGWYTDSTWRDWDYYPDKVLRFFVREDAEKSGYAHREVPSSVQVAAGLQNLKVGEVVLDGPPGTAFFTVSVVEPDHHLVYYSNSHLRFLFPKSIRENPEIGIAGEFTWAFYLQKAGEMHTRLIMRTRARVEPWWYRMLVSLTIPIANLFLSRKMLSGIKQRSEQVGTPGSQGPGTIPGG